MQKMQLWLDFFTPIRLLWVFTPRENPCTKWQKWFNSYDTNFTSRDSNRDPHSRAPSLFSRNNQDPDLTSFKTLEDDDYGFKSRFSSSQVRTKGGLISESFLLWFESPKKVLNHTHDHIHLFVKRIVWSGDSSQSEKLSEIKLPLKEVNKELVKRNIPTAR